MDSLNQSLKEMVDMVAGQEAKVLQFKRAIREIRRQMVDCSEEQKIELETLRVAHERKITQCQDEKTGLLEEIAEVRLSIADLQSLLVVDNLGQARQEQKSALAVTSVTSGRPSSIPVDTPELLVGEDFDAERYFDKFRRVMRMNEIPERRWCTILIGKISDDNLARTYERYFDSDKFKTDCRTEGSAWKAVLAWWFCRYPKIDDGDIHYKEFREACAASQGNTDVYQHSASFNELAYRAGCMEDANLARDYVNSLNTLMQEAMQQMRTREMIDARRKGETLPAFTIDIAQAMAGSLWASGRYRLPRTGGKSKLKVGEAKEKLAVAVKSCSLHPRSKNHTDAECYLQNANSSSTHKPGIATGTSGSNKPNDNSKSSSSSMIGTTIKKRCFKCNAETHLVGECPELKHQSQSLGGLTVTNAPLTLAEMIDANSHGGSFTLGALNLTTCAEEEGSDHLVGVDSPVGMSPLHIDPESTPPISTHPASHNNMITNDSSVFVMDVGMASESDLELELVRPSYTPPVSVEGDKRNWVPVEFITQNKVFQSFARHDSGAQRSLISVRMATMMNVSISKREGLISGVLEGQPAIPRIGVTAKPLEIRCGTRTCFHVFEVARFVEDAYLGADVLDILGLAPTLPKTFPSQLLAEVGRSAAEAKFTHHVRGSLVAEAGTPRPQEHPAVSGDRKQALQDIEAALQRNAKARADSNAASITFPGAEVNLEHEPGTKPAYVHPYPVKERDKDFVADTLSSWCEAGYLVSVPASESSRVTSNAPLVVSTVYESDGVTIAKQRLCLDLRGFNKGLITIPYRVPTIGQVLEKCKGGKLISELDLKGAFLQFRLNEASRGKLFIRFGAEIYEVVSGMFGMANMTDHCQRVVSQVLRGEPEATAYVDNVVLATERDYQAHATLAVRVIDQCTFYNIWFNVERSLKQLLVTAITLLGHRVDEGGTSPDPSKVMMVESWSLPKKQADLSRFLGFCGFLSGYVRHYTELAQQLRDLQQPGKNKEVQWTDKARAAFELLKYAITRAPRLNYIDWAKQFSLAVDASARGVGGVLYQPDQPSDPPKAETIIALTSRALLKHERNYPPYKLELLGLVNALVVFEHILSGIDFTVLTDHRALTFLLTQAGTNRTLGNWLSLLLEFRFKIIHIAGFKNDAADFLSRAYPDRWGVEAVPARLADDNFSLGSVSTTHEGTQTRSRKRVEQDRARAAVRHAVSPGGESVQVTNEPQDVTQMTATSMSNKGEPTRVTMEPQVQDVKHVATSMGSKGEPIRVTSTSKQLEELETAKERDRRNKVASAHSFGHFGVSATVARLKLLGEEWPKMREMVEEVLQNCRPCQAWTQGKHRFAPLLDTSAGVRLPWQQLQIDLLTSMLPSEEGWKYILVVVCVFSDFVLLRNLKTKLAREIAEVLWRIFCDFGPPKVIMSDNEATLISEALEAMMDLHGVEHITIAQLNSRALGSCEKEVGITLVTMNKLLAQVGGEWPRLTPFVQLAMNNRAQQRSGTMPFELLFNRQMNQFNHFHPLQPLAVADTADWIRHQKQVYEVLFPVVAEKIKSGREKSRRNADEKRLKAPLLEVGHVVMLKDIENQTSKLHPPYVGPYEVVGLAAKDVYYLQDSSGRVLDRPVPVDMLKLLPKAARKKWLTKPTSDNVPLEEGTFLVDRLVGHRRKNKEHQYKVLWKGYGMDQATWENVGDIDPSLVQDYLREASRVPNRVR